MAEGVSTPKDDSAEKAFAAAAEAISSPKPVEKAKPAETVSAPAPDATAKPAASNPPQADRAPTTSDTESKAPAMGVDAKKPAAPSPVKQPSAKAVKPAKAKVQAKPAKLASAKAKPAAKVVRKTAAKVSPKPVSAAPAAKPAKLPAPVSKPVAAKVPARSAKPVAVVKPATLTTPVHAISMIKDKSMSKTTDYADEMKAKMTEAQTKAKLAFEKSKVVMTEAGEFTKGNVEAMVESSKIFAAGMQDLGKTLVAEGKDAFETTTADVKTLAAVKSPTEFVKVQGDIARRNLDAMIATGSKNAESMMKVYSDAFAPISARFSLAMEKMKAAA